MKKFFLLSCLLMTGAAVFAQWNTDKSTFSVTANGQLRQENLSVQIAATGETYLVYSYPDESQQHRNLYVQILDKDGNRMLGDHGKQISTVDGPSYMSGGIATALDGEGNLLIVSGDNRHEPNGYYQQPYLYKVDKDGNQLLTQTTGDGVVQAGVSLRPNTDRGANGYALYNFGGTVYATYSAYAEDGSYDSYTFVQKLNEDATLAWDAPLRLSGGNAKLIQTDAGFMAAYSTPGYPSSICAQRYDADGNEVWDAPLTVKSGVSAWNQIPACGDGNGNAFIQYSYTDQATYASYEAIALVNADGTMIFGGATESLAVPSAYSLNKHYMLGADGSLFFIHDSREGWSGNHVLYLNSISADGNKAWGDLGKQVDEAEQTFSIPAVTLLENGDLLVTYTKSSWYTDAAVVMARISSDGEVVWRQELAPEESNDYVNTVTDARAAYTYFVYAPSSEEVGIVGTRVFLDGKYSDYDIDVNVTTAGTLSTLVSADEKYTARSMRVSGDINGDDVIFIRDLCGVCGINAWDDTDGQVTVLNLEDARIVAGGSTVVSYYDTDIWEDVDVVTEDDVFTPYFLYGTAVTDVVLPKTITAIGHDALSNCTYLTAIDIPASVSTIANSAFAGSGLVTAVVPEGVTSLGSYVFWGCANLTGVTLPSQLTTLPEGLLQQTGITSFDIPDLVTAIKGNVFADCVALESVTGGKNVTELGRYAFRNCYALATIDDLPSLTSIGTEALANCMELGGEFNVPATVAWIGNQAFFNNQKLTAINVVDGNAEYMSNDGILFSKDGKTLIACPAGKGGDITVQDGVVEIGASAFEANLGLKNVTLPASVENLGNFAFARCTNLESVTCQAVTPPSVGFNHPFYYVDVATCLLFVPEESVEAYREAEGWKDFSIVSGISGMHDATAVADNMRDIDRYDASGRRLTAPAKGLNIIRRADGSTLKTMVK